MNTSRQFYVKVYKQDSAFFPDGEMKMIHCNHQKVGLAEMTLEGIIVPLPGATSVPGTVGKNDNQQGSVMLPQSTVLPEAATIQGATSSTLITVLRIKDNVTQIGSWVDVDSYNANVVTCFPTTHN